MIDREGAPWVDWSGGFRPVSDLAVVEVRYRDGEIRTGGAGSFVWMHSQRGKADWDIIAYRILTEETGGKRG